MAKRILKVTLVIVLASVIMRIFFINSVTIFGRSTTYVDDYNEFYLCKKAVIIRPFIALDGGGTSGYKVWFLPFQKGRLLKKIKEDVNNELKDMMTNNNDIIKGYEISNDFQKIYIYYYKDARNIKLNFEAHFRIVNLEEELANRTVALKVELYHVINGDEKPSLDSKINFVEVDEQSVK